ASRSAEKRRRVWSGVAALAFVVTVAILAVVAKQRAQSRRASLANRLAGESMALWNTRRFDESMLRAVAAYQAAPTSSALRALLNAAQGEPQLAVIVHGNARNIGGVAFDARGGRLISGDGTGTVHIFDSATGTPLATFAADRQEVSQLALADDGRLLITGGWNGVIRRWDLATRKETGRPLVAGRGLVESLALHPSNRYLVAGYTEGALLWDLGADPPSFTELPLGARRRVAAVAFAEDGTTLVTGAGSLIAWSFDGGSLANRRERPLAEITTLAAHRDTIVAGSASGTIYRLRAEDLSEVGRVESGEFVFALTIDDERLAAAGSTAGRVWVGNAASPTTFPTRERVFAVALEQGTSRVAFGGEDGRIHVLDVAMRQPLAEVVHRVRASIQDIAFDSGGGAVVITTLDDDRFRVDTTSRERVDLPPLQRSDDVTAAAEAAGVRLTGHRDGSVRLWRGSSATPLTGAKLDLVMTVAFSPDGDLFLAGDNDGNLASWNAKSLAFQRRWKTAGTAVASLAFSPDGRRVAVVDAGTARITVIDVRESTPKSFDGECERSFSAAFRSDGQTLVTGCNDGSLEILDVVTRERLGSISDHEDPPDPDFVMALARHPREDRFAAGTEDGRVMLWQLEPSFWMRRACRRANRDLAEEIPEWTGAPLVPCSRLLKDAPSDTRKPDVEPDDNEGPRIPINMAVLTALRAGNP
ncbi:MAG: WD40 repeat domain-containing protein, partial [Thermoanaerobaculia bacterium]